jgi:hypothetical protein
MRMQAEQTRVIEVVFAMRLEMKNSRAVRDSCKDFWACFVYPLTRKTAFLYEEKDEGKRGTR